LLKGLFATNRFFTPMIRVFPLSAWLVFLAAVQAGVVVDVEKFGESLGGWKADSKKAADYEISGSHYRTYRPAVTPTPNGGIFVSVRIDHRRGWLAADDTASLELTFGPDGKLESARSTMAFQGRKITSDVIRSTTKAGTSIAGPGIDQAVRISTDLVADLSSKLLREKIVEPGRVSFPAAIRHNFNLLYAAVRLEPAGEGVHPPAGTTEHSVNPPAKDPAHPKKPAEKPKPAADLEIKPFQPGKAPKPLKTK
jgi:hypothetical protein